MFPFVLGPQIFLNNLEQEKQLFCGGASCRLVSTISMTWDVSQKICETCEGQGCLMFLSTTDGLPKSGRGRILGWAGSSEDDARRTGGETVQSEGPVCYLQNIRPKGWRLGYRMAFDLRARIHVSPLENPWRD